jgi:GNAT superfamily N-acetyltransferase
VEQKRGHRLEFHPWRTRIRGLHNRVSVGVPLHRVDRPVGAAERFTFRILESISNSFTAVSRLPKAPGSSSRRCHSQYREQPSEGDFMRASNSELAIASDAATARDAFAATPTPPSARSVASPVVAQLGPAHEAQFLDLQLGLDNASRVARFGHGVGDAAIIAHGKGTLSTAAFIAGVFLDGNLRGAVDVFEGEGGVHKIALAVHQDWRRRGFGLALLTAAREWAQQSGVITLRLVMSRSNWPMRNLAQKVGARFDLSLDEIRADIPAAKRHCSLAAAHLEEIYT